jgi:RHS repeat-associated protein
VGYTYDENGNRVSIDKNIPNTGTLPVRNETASYSHNRLTSTDTALYGYDNEGQLASKQAGGTVSYSFDKAYRLVGIGSTESFSYDGAGNRLRAVRNGVEVRYIYDANGNLLAEADSSNTITRYYVHGAGLLAAITPAGDLYCYHYDGVGNTVAVTDASEAVVNSYDYSPFGMILAENETFPQPFKFVGKLGVMAESNGFYYMRARYYDPMVGRFISEDPLGFDGGDVNLYVYAGLNPLLVVDPWGKESQQYGSIRNAPGFFESIGDSVRTDVDRVVHPDRYGENARVNTVMTYTAVAVDVVAGTIATQPLSSYGVRLAIHGPHHTFGRFGRLPHIQLNIWRKGVKGSGRAFRIPLPRR